MENMVNSYEKARKLFDFHLPYMTYLGSRNIYFNDNQLRLLEFNLEKKIAIVDASCRQINYIFLDFDGEVIEYQYD